jgi:lysozyme
MEIPATAVILCKRWEGLHKVGADGLVYPYICPAGVWTIGYGSTRLADGSPITEHTRPHTPEECEELLMRDLYIRARKLLEMSPILGLLPESFGAILSFTYNLGTGAYARSTLRRRVDEGDFEQAKLEILKWVWAGGRRLKGLVERRKDEATYLGT